MKSFYNRLISFFKVSYLSARSASRPRQSACEARVYLDHAGATMIGARAKRALLTTMELYGNASAIYQEGIDAKNALKSAREKIARILSSHSYELYFTGSGTESIALAINGTVDYFHSIHSKNDHSEGSSDEMLPHIITTSIEHPAVLETLRALEQKRKVTVTYLPVSAQGLVELKSVREALTSTTILVSIMYVNNEIGTIQPIKDIGRMLSLYRKEKEVEDTHTAIIDAQYPYFHVDACQAANYLSLDVQSLRVDLMTLNSSKVYGPKGVGLLYKREGVMLLPQILGGGQERGLRSGTESVPLIVSFAEALDEAHDLRTRDGDDNEVNRLIILRTLLYTLLRDTIPSIVFYGSFEKGERVPNNINCRIPGLSSEEVILRLDAKGFAVSHKSACASESESGSHVILALGENEIAASENIRITMGRSTKEEDVKRLVEEMKEIAEKYKR